MWVKSQWTPPLQRVHDQSLMRAFSNLDKITQGKLDKANHCQMYIKCITIADLANERGLLIPGSRMNGEWRAASKLASPWLPKPPTSCWTVFQWCMQKASSSIHRPSIFKQPVWLDQPLGPCWKAERHFQYQYYRTNNEVYNWDGNRFLRYINPTTRAQIVDAHGAIVTLPPDAHLINVIHDADYLWTTNKCPIMINVPRMNDSVLDYVIDGDGPKMSGYDGSVNIISGDRVSAYYVQVGGHQFGGARKFPSSQYSTYYQAEMEGMNNPESYQQNCSNRWNRTVCWQLASSRER